MRTSLGPSEGEGANARPAPACRLPAEASIIAETTHVAGTPREHSRPSGGAYQNFGRNYQTGRFQADHLLV